MTDVPVGRLMDDGRFFYPFIRDHVTTKSLFKNGWLWVPAKGCWIGKHQKQEPPVPFTKG